MKRILLLVATNVAVLVVLSVVMRLLGLESILNESGTQLDLQALLIFSAVIGFAGSFISLAMSKWIAKRSTGAHVIDVPRDSTERWLLETVQRQYEAQSQLLTLRLDEITARIALARLLGPDRDDAPMGDAS